MKPERALAIELKYFSRALMRSDDFDYENEYMLPIKVSYEYKLKNDVVTAVNYLQKKYQILY